MGSAFGTPCRGGGLGRGRGQLTFQAHSCNQPALRSEIFGINYLSSPALRSLSWLRHRGEWVWGFGGVGRDWGRDERHRTLTSTRQTSDKLFHRHSHPAHLVCISLRLPSSPLATLPPPSRSTPPSCLIRLPLIPFESHACLGPIQRGPGPSRNQLGFLCGTVGCWGWGNGPPSQKPLPVEDSQQSEMG